MADLPQRVRPTLRCLCHDPTLAIGPTDDPLDEIDHPLLAKPNEQFADPATPHERIAAIDDQVLFKVKVQRWRGAIWADTPDAPVRDWPVTPGFTSRVVCLLGDGTAGVSVHDDAGPVGVPVRVPWMDHPARHGLWVATLIELSGGTPPPEPVTCRVELDPVSGPELDVRVTWPDLRCTRTLIETRETG